MIVAERSALEDPHSLVTVDLLIRTDKPFIDSGGITADFEC